MLNMYGYDSYTNFENQFNTASNMVNIFFMIFIGVFVFIVIRGIMEWNKNNHSPRLTVKATVVGKRVDVHHHHNHVNNMPTTTTSSDYYVTFEVDSGDRIVFQLSGHEYSMLVEGDFGDLTFQGTRYIDFSRF